MTDLQREENAAILLSHSQIKPEFFTHSGTFISDLTDLVDRRLAEPEYRPGFCERCGSFREVAKPIGYETGDYEMVPCPECAL